MVFSQLRSLELCSGFSVSTKVYRLQYLTTGPKRIWKTTMAATTTTTRRRRWRRKKIEEEEEEQQQQLFPFYFGGLQIPLHVELQQRFTKSHIRGMAVARAPPTWSSVCRRMLCWRSRRSVEIHCRMAVSWAFTSGRVGAEHCSTTGHKTSGKKTLWMVAESWKPADGLNHYRVSTIQGAGFLPQHVPFLLI